MKYPKIETRKLSELAPNTKNPRKVSAEAIGRLTKSLSELGNLSPITFNVRTGKILSGHQRLKCLVAMGHTESDVWCVDLPAEKESTAMLAMNNHAGEWDEDELQKLLAEIDTSDRELTGFKEEEITSLLDKIEKTIEADPQIDRAAELQSEWKTERGQIWELGEHRLMCGDSSVPRNVELVLSGNSIGVTIVDPPYEVQAQTWAKWIQDPSIVFGQGRQIKMIPDKLWRFERVIVKNYRHRSATVQVNHRHAWVVQCGSEKVLPKDKSVTLESVVEQEANTEHDHQKPVALLVEHLKHWTPPGLVFDPYAGSGSSIIASEQCGRPCCAIEIDPSSVALILQRFLDATRVQPKLLESENV